MSECESTIGHVTVTCAGVYPDHYWVVAVWKPELAPFSRAMSLPEQVYGAQRAQDLAYAAADRLRRGEPWVDVFASTPRS